MLKAQYAIMVMCFHPSTSYVAECTQSTFNANAKYFKNIADFFIECQLPLNCLNVLPTAWI